MTQKVQHDFLNPGKELNLDITLGEAEILMSANGDVRAMAEQGTLKALHERCSKIQEKVDADHLRTRDSLARIL